LRQFNFFRLLKSNERAETTFAMKATLQPIRRNFFVLQRAEICGDFVFSCYSATRKFGDSTLVFKRIAAKFITV
jgi:hypothetical protein